MVYRIAIPPKNGRGLVGRQAGARLRTCAQRSRLWRRPVPRPCRGWYTVIVCQIQPHAAPRGDGAFPPSRAMSLRRTIPALVFAAAAPLCAQTSAASITSRIAPAERARIDAVFKEFDKPHVPGCALGVMQNGQLAYGRGYGWADLERNVGITTTSHIAIASTSKQFTT